MVGRRDIIFLNRAYNDMDTQMSLVDAFAVDGRFSVRVIGYPCDGDIGTPDAHEAAAYMKARYGVVFETVLDRAPAPLYLRALYRMTRTLGGFRRQGWAEAKTLALPLKLAHVGLLKIMRAALTRPLPWLDGIANTWSLAAIILDEVYAQPGRSYMTDTVLPRLQERGVPVYMIQTGHNIYRNPHPGGRKAPYKQTAAARFFMPSALDFAIDSEIFPQERHEVAGNLRMDADWLRRLGAEILMPPHYPGDDVMCDLPRGKVKVAVMLSKLTYGVDAEALKDTIRMLARMDDVALAIKPHTRGMKFDFMSQAEIGAAVIADRIPSALLSEWADMVLFTGSSVVYHAMLRGKAAGFLKYCQTMETVFDKGESAITFTSKEQLRDAIEMARGGGFMDAAEAARVREHLRVEVHAGDPEGRTAQRHMRAILADMGMDAMKAAE